MLRVGLGPYSEALYIRVSIHYRDWLQAEIK